MDRTSRPLHRSRRCPPRRSFRLQHLPVVTSGWGQSMPACFDCEVALSPLLRLAFRISESIACSPGIETKCMPAQTEVWLAGTEHDLHKPDFRKPCDKPGFSR